MPPTNSTSTMDNDVINLAKAIRQTESGGDFNAKGGSGESGAYQWMPNTWKAHAKQALGNENADMSPSNQNAVAYTVLKSWKDQGLNPAQIAAKWNSGSETGWENKRGVNSAGIQYDVPKYVKSVTDAYQEVKRGGTPQMDPNNPSSLSGTQQGEQPNPDILANKLNARAEQFSNAGNEGGYFGQSVIGRLGAVAGGINDVIGAAVSPIINKTVDIISDIPTVQKFAGSKPVSSTLDVINSTTKEIGKDYKQFEENNPKTGQFLRDTGNIASLIPTGKGLQVGKNIAVDTTKGLARTALPNAPENIMNGVARLTKKEADDFQTRFGESHGKYLSRTGNIENPEKIIQNEYNKFKQTLADKEAALATLEGKFKDSSITNALKELVAKEERIGVPDASGSTAKIAQYAREADTNGLSMPQINEVKQLLEKSKIDYYKQNLPDGVERIKRIDTDIRNWQDMQSKRLGLTNLHELSKQIRMSKFIVDKLGKQLAGKVGNNAIGLTDWIILSGMDPSAIGGFLTKKALLSTKARTLTAKLFAQKAEKPVKPKYGGKTGLPALIPGRNYTPPKNKVKSTVLPASIREQNIGLDEVKNAKIRDTNKQTLLLSERAGAIELPIPKGQSNLKSTTLNQPQLEKSKSSSIIPANASKGNGLVSTSKIAKIKDPKKLSNAIEKKYGIKNAEFIAEDVVALRKEGGLTDKQIENFIKEAVKKYE